MRQIKNLIGLFLTAFAGLLVLPGLDILLYLFLQPHGFWQTVVFLLLVLISFYPSLMLALGVTYLVAKVLGV